MVLFSDMIRTLFSLMYIDLYLSFVKNMFLDYDNRII